MSGGCHGPGPRLEIDLGNFTAAGLADTGQGTGRV